MACHLHGNPSAAPVPRLITDVLRVLAIIGVIAIHATDAWRLVPGSPHSFGDWAAVILDQSCRFCVPLFVLLSGYVLGKRYGRDPAFTAADFLLRRVSRIGAPFMLWSLLNLLILTAIGVWHWRQSPESAFTAAVHDGNNQPISLLHWLAIGGADYHLYFLPIIVQCYLAFPLLRQWRPSVFRVSGVVLALVAWTVYQEGTRLYGWPWPGLWSTFPLPWLLLFQLGCWVADGDIVVATQLRRIPHLFAVMLVLSGPLWCIGDWWWVSSTGVNSASAGDFSRPAAPWYALVVLGAALRWSALWEPRLSRFAPIICAGSLCSFATYLAHTWVLRGLTALGFATLGRLVWIPLAIAASFIIGYALQRAARRWSALRWLVGG